MHPNANYDWTAPKDQCGRDTNDGAMIAILQDIRGELRRIRTIAECPNCLDIPHKLDRIEKNTRRPKRRKKFNRH